MRACNFFFILKPSYRQRHPRQAKESQNDDDTNTNFKEDTDRPPTPNQNQKCKNLPCLTARANVTCCLPCLTARANGTCCVAPAPVQCRRKKMIKTHANPPQNRPFLPEPEEEHKRLIPNIFQAHQWSPQNSHVYCHGRPFIFNI